MRNHVCLRLRRAVAVLAAFLASTAIALAGSRGYLTTPEELARVRDKAAQGAEPYRSAVRQVLQYASDAALPQPASGTVACRASRTPAYVTAGAPIVYSYGLAFHLTGDPSYARKARSAILDLQKITGLEAGDCPLTMGRHVPTWIRAADLIEDVWPKEEKRRFQNWLATVIFPSLMTKCRRGNNWGAMITNAGQHIADYCLDRRDLLLDGQPPAAAYRLMRQLALDRMNGLIWDACGEGVSMIRPDGGIPEELRRSTRCEDTAMRRGSAAQHYSEGYLSGLLAQAELCLRRGDPALFDSVSKAAARTPGGKPLPAGRGSIRNAIDFVLDRVPWERKQSLMIAARYYRDPRMLAAAREGRPHGVGPDVNPFTTLTHDYADGETPALPPVTTP